MLLPCCAAGLLFSAFGGFFVLVFHSLRGLAGCFSVSLAAQVLRLFVSHFWPQAFVRLAQSRREYIPKKKSKIKRLHKYFETYTDATLDRSTRQKAC